MNNQDGGRFLNEIKITSVHSNLTQEVVQITIDKLRLILNEHVQSMECRKCWIAPFGILITILMVFATTDFKDAIFKADTWQAFFFMAMIITAVWLIRDVLRAIKSKSIENIIDKIKAIDSGESPNL